MKSKQPELSHSSSFISKQVKDILNTPNTHEMFCRQNPEVAHYIEAHFDTLCETKEFKQFLQSVTDPLKILIDSLLQIEKNSNNIQTTPYNQNDDEDEFDDPLISSSREINNPIEFFPEKDVLNTDLSLALLREKQGRILEARIIFDDIFEKNKEFSPFWLYIFRFYRDYFPNETPKFFYLFQKTLETDPQNLDFLFNICGVL